MTDNDDGMEWNSKTFLDAGAGAACTLRELYLFVPPQAAVAMS
jgi:hypothetical protein